MPDVPEVRYAKSGDVRLAYQIVGDGPIDVILVPGFASNIEITWEHPAFTRLWRRISRFPARLVLFDKRGTGNSDRVGGAPSLEERVDDLRAVMDAVGSESAVLSGESEGAALCALFAAMFPDRVQSLMITGGWARWLRADDMPWAPDAESWEQTVQRVEEIWGQGLVYGANFPHLLGDEAMVRWFGRYERLSASPSAVGELLRLNASIDLREVLPSVQTRTLVLHRVGNPTVPVEHGRYLAAHIPGATYHELPGDFYAGWYEDVIDELEIAEAWLTGATTSPDLHRALSTVLVSDIVGSTELATRLGDERWQAVLDRHDMLVREQVERFRGRVVKGTGDGVLATFDGPARAIRAASSLATATTGLGVEVRVGLHAGEIELRHGDDDIGGIAVNVATRVSAEAGAGEVLVTDTLRDLVAGSGLTFEDRGTHELKGVDGPRRLYAAVV